MTHSRPVFACALALLVVLGSVLPAWARASDIIVARDPGLSAAERAQVRDGAGARLERTLPVPNTEVVSVPDGQEQAALAALDADPGVRYAVPDVAVHTAAGDAMWWELNNFNDADVDAPEAWESSYEGQGVTVGVVDMGIDAGHPELLGNVESAEDFVDPAVACKSASLPTGERDHGTHVAGIIAAQRDGRGIVGLAPLAHVKPLRAFDDCGVGQLSAVLTAFEWAGSHGLPIVSGSFGTNPLLPQADKDHINDLISRVLDAHPGTLYVVAAGNEGNNNDELPVYPCSNDADNLVCVGMTDSMDRPTCWGNIGSGAVDLFAPGEDIYSTVRGFPFYERLSGTSQATALVAAAAALIESQDPQFFGAQQLKDALMDGTDLLPFLGTLSQTGGRLNAARSMRNHPGSLGDGYQGERMPWKSCDADHDGFHAAQDTCPDEPGPLNGCPDYDRDGVPDASDNCVHDANPGQENADGDALGDVCDSTPRGPDFDGDQRGALDDRCPAQFAETDDGCPKAQVSPTPTPVPRPRSPEPAPTSTPTLVAAAKIVSLDVKVNPRSCGARRPCKKSAKVTVKLTRTAKVALRVERRVRSHGRWVWRRVTLRSLTATVSGKSLTVRGSRGASLRKGSYRVIATLAGGGDVCKFKV